MTYTYYSYHDEVNTTAAYNRALGTIDLYRRQIESNQNRSQELQSILTHVQRQEETLDQANAHIKFFDAQILELRTGK